MLLEIFGHHLPGRSWCSHDNVHVGIQVGKDASDLVRADAETTAWRVPIDVVPQDGALDFRGPAVHGRPGARFVYLTWGNVGRDGAFTMFRRAKLMLDDLTPYLSGADDVARMVAHIDLTDEHGGPRCARLRAPALELQSQSS